MIASIAGNGHTRTIDAGAIVERDNKLLCALSLHQSRTYNAAGPTHLLPSSPYTSQIVQTTVGA